ncbi:MAG: sugar phosphate isomerase/epimerase [Lachnospiraceae bacterium]|nr:sugar phosphate isomerase/epimerase [Lachnospiraceae bacterium]
MNRKVHLIPDFENIEKSLILEKKYDAAFEYNDFFNPSLLEDEKALKERIAFYKSLDRDRKNDTLHGVFFDITLNSSDPAIKKISEERCISSLDIATELGVSGVIFHTNYLANFKAKYYEDSWVNLNRDFWIKMLKRYENLCIYIENMFDEEPELLVRLIEKVKSSDELTEKEKDRFGICFDYAHANAFGHDLSVWEDAVAPYVMHMHINDNDLNVDLHQTMGDGMIDWERFNRFVQKKNIESSVLVEVKDLKSQSDSVEYMKENGIYPYDR